MSIQRTIQNDFETIAITSVSDEELIKGDDPVFSYIPNPTQLQCYQVDPAFVDVRKNFFNDICGRGNATNDLRGREDEVLHLTKYIESKEISTLINQDCPEDMQAIIEAVKKCFMGTLALRAAQDSHTKENHLSASLKTCGRPTAIFTDLYFQMVLTRAQRFINKIDFTKLDGDVLNLVVYVYDEIKKVETVPIGRNAERRVRLISKRVEHKSEKRHQAFSQRFNTIQEFCDIMNSSRALSELASLALQQRLQEGNRIDAILQIVREEKDRKANENADRLLKELEEEESKKKSRKARTSKKPVHSSHQPRTISTAEVTDAKQALPKKTLQPSDIDLLKDLDRIVTKDLSVHPRVERWSKTMPETINHIQDWDPEEEQWVSTYERDPSPDYTIACHDLALIVRLLRSKLAETYAKPFSFVDTENKTREGWAFVADMRWKGQEYKGTIFAAVGDDNVLYHSHFRPFDQNSRQPMIDVLCEQLKEMVHGDKTVEAKPKEESKKWKPVGTYSTERDETGKDLLLVMHNQKRGSTFVFHPLKEV